MKPIPRPGTVAEVKPGGFQVVRKGKGVGERVLLYGCGGIGKTTLCTLAPKPLWIDCEDSAKHLDVPRISGIETFADLRRAVQSHDLFAGYQTLVVDTLTAVQRMVVDDVVANVKGDKPIKSIEDFGYGKGYRFVFDRFVQLLGDLDHLCKAGINVVLICHDMIDRSVNPEGTDFLRYEPAMVQTKGSAAPVRDEVCGWADHVLFIKYDIAVSEKGKAVGGGSRTLWPQEQPAFVAKSRVLRQPIPIIEGDPAVWNQLFGGAA